MRPARAAQATSAPSWPCCGNTSPTGIPAYQALVVERNASRLLRNLRRHGCLGGLQDAAGASAETSQPSRPEMGGPLGS